MNPEFANVAFWYSAAVATWGVWALIHTAPARRAKRRAKNSH